MKLTQEEIDALPRPMKMMRDLVLVKRQGFKERKVGSIFLPEEQTALPDQICRVLDVGEGLVIERGVIRKPQCQRGDLIFCTPTDGYPVTVNGEEFHVYEWSTEVIGIILDESVSIFGKEHC